MVDKFNKYKLPESEEHEGVEMGEFPHRALQETMAYGIPIEEDS